MPLKHLLKWAPFKIDALGLLTLLGADEVNRAIGTLTLNRITEFLPLMGGHVIAGDTIRQPYPGYTLYNISDGICASDLSPWFSRWLRSQELTYNTTTLTIGSINLLKRKRQIFFRPLCLGIVVNAFLVGFSVLLGDWWGFSNALALAIAVILRTTMTGALREAVDSSAMLASYQSQDLVKSLCTLPDGCTVIIYASRGSITECLLSNPKPRHLKAYATLKIASWVVFAIHIVSIGMAALPTQIVTVIVAVTSTICAITGIGADQQHIGTQIQIRRVDLSGGSQSMAAMFERLRLTTTEEECMVSWRLMPSKNNQIWWDKYRRCIAEGKADAFDNWKDKSSWDKIISI